LNVRGKAEGFFQWMIFSIRNSWFKRHFPLVMESEAVLICMAFPILRKYFWEEEEREEEGGEHLSSVEISCE